VKRFCDLFKANPEEKFNWKLKEGRKPSAIPFETPITLREAVQKFCDLRSFPTKLLLKKIMKMVKAPQDIEDL